MRLGLGLGLDESRVRAGPKRSYQPLNNWDVSNVEMEKVRIRMTDSTFFYLSRG